MKKVEGQKLKEFGMLKKKNFLTLLVADESAYQNICGVISFEFTLFLVRYMFIFGTKKSVNEISKREFPPLGELFSQNPNGARYLDPKYSHWISVDPALGEYVPSAGKSNEADKLPGMGGIFNSVNLSLYHYAGNNPVKYVDPDGRVDWNRAYDGDYLYNSIDDPDLIYSPASFYTKIEHYRATRESGNINSHYYSLSGTKDIIEIKQGGIPLQTSTLILLKRYNINIDGENYDVFSIFGISKTRLLFKTDNPRYLISTFIAKDPENDDGSIYNGFFNRDNFIEYLKTEDTWDVFFSALSFGLTSKTTPLLGNFTEGLIDYLSSKAEGKIPSTKGIDKKTIDLIYKIIAEQD